MSDLSVIARFCMIVTVSLIATFDLVQL